MPEAAVVRTAGGRVHAAMSTLCVLAAVGNQGYKGTILVVHHTDCGLASVTDEGVRECMRQGKELALEEERWLDEVRFGAFVE